MVGITTPQRGGQPTFLVKGQIVNIFKLFGLSSLCCMKNYKQHVSKWM